MTSSINRMSMTLITLTLAIVIASGGVSLWSNLSQGQAMMEMQRISKLLRNHMNADMMHDAVRADVLSLLSPPETGIDLAASRGELAEHLATLRENIAIDRQYTGSPAITAATRSVAPRVEAYAAAANSIARLAVRDRAAAIAGLPGFLKEFGVLEEAMSGVSDAIEARSVAVEAGAHRSASLGLILLLGGMLASLLTIGTIGIACRRLLVRPLIQLVAVMKSMADGDMTVAIPASRRRDELGQLTDTTVRFRDQLVAADADKQAQVTLICDSIGSGLGALSSGDLTARIDADLTGPFAKLKTDFNAAIEALNATLSTVSQSTSRIRIGSTEISQSSDNLSRRTEQQAASLEETAAAMDEITTTVRQTASNAARANAIVAEAGSDAQESGRVVRSAIEAMSDIENASNEISEIISVIDGIAFQTNLLALNAGVEAARAGDAGRGFAVVASEVRALAQRSANAAQDVKSKITASAGHVGVGVKLVGQAGEVLERIAVRIGEIKVIASEIATSAEQQASGLQQVNIAVGEMDSVTQQNAAMVEESTAAARDLASEADDLAGSVSRFQLADGETATRPRVAAAPHRREPRYRSAA